MGALALSNGKVTREDGSKGALGMAADHAAWRDAQPTATRCALCGRSHRGTAAEGRAWARSHREELHPEAARAGGRRPTPEQQREAAMLRSEWRRRRYRGEE